MNSSTVQTAARRGLTAAVEGQVTQAAATETVTGPDLPTGARAAAASAAGAPLPTGNPPAAGQSAPASAPSPPPCHLFAPRQADAARQPHAAAATSPPLRRRRTSLLAAAAVATKRAHTATGCRRHGATPWRHTRGHRHRASNRRPPQSAHRGRLPQIPPWRWHPRQQL